MSNVGIATEPARDRCTTPDGVGIALYDFGGHGPDLLLVHATGFCAEPFGPLARALGEQYRCWGLDLRGHGRSDRPVDGDFAWSGFATDLLAVVDHLGLREPFGFGHSCGGATVLMAQQSRPGLFRSLFCFEPVVMPDAARAVVAASNPLADGARRRRSTFPSAEEALANYASKPPYAELDPEALRLYVQGGFEPVPASEGGDGRAVRLRCRREDEADTFAAAGLNEVFAHLPEVVCPVTFCCGEQTDAFGENLMLADAAPVPDARVEVLAGMGHFGPLQAPDVVADAVIRAFGSDEGPGAGTPPS